jgi:hypothetical protein
VNLVYAEEAERLIAHENAQWTAYAEYPLLFEQELDEAIEEIQKQPYRPVYATSPRGKIRRILMPKTAHHVYFLYSPETETIEIVSLSGGKKKEGPSFRR